MTALNQLLILVSVVMICLQTVTAALLCDDACANTSEPLAICNTTRDQGRSALSIMGFFPCNVGSYRGRALVVAAQMAASIIRGSRSLLPDYNLEIEFDNTMCSRTAGVRGLIRQLQDTVQGGPVRHMIVGPGCSSAAILIAETSPYYHLTQISYSATSITLSNKQRFPNFLRSISSDNGSIALLGDLAEEYEWKQIALVTLNNDNFVNLTNTMVEALARRGVNVLTERLSIDPEAGVDKILIRNIVEQLNISGARVVFLNIFEDVARELFCFAYQRGMLYPQYLFITYFWYSDGWWTEPINDCTPDQLAMTVEFSIAMDFFPEPPPNKWNTPTDVVLTYNEFWKYFRGNITSLGYPAIEALSQGIYVYDAVWAAARALDSVERQLQNGEVPGMSSLLNFSYSNTQMNELVLQAARSGIFRGVSGIVSINEFGDREPLGRFYQYSFGNKSVAVPTFNVFLYQDNGSLLYRDGYTPETVFPAGLPATVLPLNVHVGLWSVAIVVSVAGIVFSLFLIAFNIILRKKSCIKMTSPYLNVVIFIGAIFFYVDVILFGIDNNVASSSAVDILCQARIWVSSIGFTLLFGPILVKAFRVYYIFRNIHKTKKSPLMKDYILLLLVAAMVVVDVVFLAVVSLDDWRLRFSSTLRQRSNGEIPVVVSRCVSLAGVIWLSVLLAYKAVYLLIGLLLASQTFNVKIKRLRDARLIVISVFSIFIVSSLLTVIGLFVDGSPNTLYALQAFFILGLLIGIQLLLFVPRAVDLIWDKSGEEPFTSTISSQMSVISEVDTEIEELKNTLNSLRKEIEKISLAQKDVKARSSLHQGKDTESQADVTTSM